MTNKITHTPVFENRFKRFLKKFLSLENELVDLEKNLLQNPKSENHLEQAFIKFALQVRTRGKEKVEVFELYPSNQRNRRLVRDFFNYHLR